MKTKTQEQKVLMIGFDSVANGKYHIQGKSKLAKLVEAVYLAETYVKDIDKVEFVNVGFSNYVFNRMIESEPQDKRSLISKSNYFGMYNVSGERLDALNAEYNAINVPMLADYSNYDLNKDFNIYLTHPKAIENYKRLKKVIDWFNDKDNSHLFNANLMQDSLRKWCDKRNGKLEFKVSNAKNL